jgi:acyl-CoA synthetase (AMP-forming)/AMP-acid ligase II
MTNRAEFLVVAFGIALAGGVVTPLSTLSTPTELDLLLAQLACSVPLMESRVLKKDLAEVLLQLALELADARPGEIGSLRYPFLRHIVAVDCDTVRGAIESWTDFLARGAHVNDWQVEACAATVMPADPGVLFFSSGTTGRPKGTLSAQRSISIQLWRWKRIFAVHDQPRCWTANGMFWSGQFAMAIGLSLSSSGCLVMQSAFDPEEALSLFEAERVTLPMAWPHLWAQLRAARNWADVVLFSLVYVDAENPLREHPTVNASWSEPTRIYGNTETFTLSAGYESGTSEELIGRSYGFPLPGMTITILDLLTGETLPIGERGEIAVEGATLMLGCIGVPLDETLDHEGFFRTGDAGYLDAQGRFYWEGKISASRAAPRSKWPSCASW